MIQQIPPTKPTGSEKNEREAELYTNALEAELFCLLHGFLTHCLVNSVDLIGLIISRIICIKMTSY